jgi:K+-sensing histidine kinase KdpD
LIDFTRTFLETAFHPYCPQDIHRHCSHAEQVECFASRENEFSQSREAKRLWTAIFEAVGLNPSGTMDRLFDAFYTTKPGGLGMGLSICRSILDAHGGRLWASPQSPRGAVFQFTVPTAQKRVPD